MCPLRHITHVKKAQVQNLTVYVCAECRHKTRKDKPKMQAHDMVCSCWS